MQIHISLFTLTILDPVVSLSSVYLRLKKSCMRKRRDQRPNRKSWKEWPEICPYIHAQDLGVSWKKYIAI